MTRRYFSQTDISQPKIKLTGPEAHHLTHVMRAAPGERISIFDGSGAEAEAEIERLDRGEALLRIIRRDWIDRELSVDITLAVALPKGDRQKWLVEKAVELGTTAIIPLLTERSVVRPKRESLTRLNRTVIEASKQCGRNRLMQIEEPCDWNDFIRGTCGQPNRFLTHPGQNARTGRNNDELHGSGVQQNHSIQNGNNVPRGDNDNKTLAATSVILPVDNIISLQNPSDRVKIIAAVGPEGGFSDREIAMALEAGWQPIGLGCRILRVETAAVLVMGILSAAYLE